MEGNNQALVPARHREYMVAAVNSRQFPSPPLDDAREVAPGYSFQTATSMT